MDIITMARELGKAIQQEQVYHDLTAAKKLNDDDEALQKLIEQFSVINTAYEIEGGKDHPDEKRCAEYEKQLESMYGEIMSNTNMARFELAKNRMDELMNKVVAILAAAVNGEDPMTVDPEQLIHDDECGGDCDCCGHHHCDDED